MYLGYCALHLTLLFKLNSFFSLGLLSPGIHNGRGKKLTNNYMQIKRFFFCCQGNLKHFLENYRFCRKSGNDAYSKRWRGHVICVNTTHCVRESICDSPLTVKNYAWNDLKIFHLKVWMGKQIERGSKNFPDVVSNWIKLFLSW